MAFRIIAGLGNPGRQYEDTRHNVGFMVLDLLARREGVAFHSSPKWQCQTAKLQDGTLLVKPQTFMNLSGRALSQLLSFHKWPSTDMLVIYDDISLPLGVLRFREKGSAGGHNGIKSILQHLGSDVFPRLKIGIGGCVPGELVGHVLGKFSPDERGTVENTLATACDAVQTARSKGIACAANGFHTKPSLPIVSPHPNQPHPTHPDATQIPRSDRP